MHVFASFAGGKIEEKLARSTFTFDFHCGAGGGRGEARRRDAVSLAQSLGPFHSSLGGAGAVEIVHLMICFACILLPELICHLQARTTRMMLLKVVDSRNKHPYD